MPYSDPDRDRQISELRAENRRIGAELHEASTARAAGIRYAHELQRSADPAVRAAGFRMEEILGGSLVD